ncbi:hypothetical protein A3C59_00010 [Candidatus Daviesbacteria bacterium RIFCSPHIGHO2_02_FULL_36_13]|uniref:Uncharacterized protein n=1 Tax=Candidatus Daviesbacteria bacterium RIFCSPHIGHO2_02_FULL_36_13 TaxID=1797768 RepID=A0A1F5JY92_9BACT|nr:MAG: hypothetical protein A3C59_00010 [Candidatus Daviesbacteria bacterium RIFCSPHIGHO2_02_FULL_36_13]
MAQGPETREQILERSPFLDTFIRLGRPDEKPNSWEFVADQRTVFVEKLGREYTPNGALLIIRGPLIATIVGGMFKMGRDNVGYASQDVEIGLQAGFEIGSVENLEGNPELQEDITKAFIHYGTSYGKSLATDFVKNAFDKGNTSERLFRGLLLYGVTIKSVYSRTDLPPDIENFIRNLPSL